MRQKAFTMLELVVVIVVAGIIAMMAIPRIQRNSLVECADQVVNHIRYTQHLAIDHNEYDRSDPTWFQNYWRILFHDTAPQGGWSYTIFRDSAGKHTGNPNSADEIARDPASDTKLLSPGYGNLKASAPLHFSKKLAIEKRYGVKDVKISAFGYGDDLKTISFDSFGRPMGALQNSKMPYDKLFRINNNCSNDGCRMIKILLCDTKGCPSSGKQIEIDVWMESGFIEVNQDPNISTALQGE